MKTGATSLSRRDVFVRLAASITAISTSSCGWGKGQNATPGRPAGSVSVREARFSGGAKGDGVADDTNAIQAAIDSAPVIFIPPGTYIVSTSLILPQDRRIVGAGSSTILKKKHDRVGRVIVNAPNAASGIIVERLTIDGRRASTAYISGTDGIFLSRCVDAVVRDVTVRNCLNDGIVVEYGSGNRVTGCAVYDNAKDGIYSSGGKDIVIDGNQTRGNLVAGIAVAATSGGLVTKNSSQRNRSDIMLGRDSRAIRVMDNICLSPVAFVTVGENLVAQTLHGIVYPTKPARGWDWVYGVTSCTLSGNRFGGAVRLILFNDGEVSGNVCTGSPSQGVLLQGSSRNRVFHNIVRDWGANFYGIQLASLTAIDGASASQGLPIRSTDNVITENDLFNTNSRNGTVDDGRRNTLARNSFAPSR